MLPKRRHSRKKTGQFRLMISKFKADFTPEQMSSDLRSAPRGEGAAGEGHGPGRKLVREYVDFYRKYVDGRVLF